MKLMKIAPLSLPLLLIVFSTSSLLHAGEQWNQFRGPEGNGHALTKNLPLKWSETEHVVWKTKIHDRGWSSPVIWHNQVWVTTSTQNGHKLFAVCVDRKTGKVIHDIHVFDVDQPQRLAAGNSYASPTPVIEEGRVYLHYGTYGTACLDSSSAKILWTRRDLKCDHEDGAGPGSSPMIVGNQLIMNFDGRDVQYMIALDKTNGKTLWKADRSEDYSKIPIHQRKGYTMPLLIPRGTNKQLVSPGGRAIYSYNSETGEELWKIRHRGWSMAPRPIYGKGLVFVVMDYDRPELWAIRPDGNGDVTDSHVAWKATRGVSARSSPVLVNDLIFMVTNRGAISCLEAETGKQVWKNRLPGNYSASPIYASNRIYFSNEESVTTVIEPARTFKVLAENRLEKEELLASPAVAGNALFIRTEKHLYRIENTPSK